MTKYSFSLFPKGFLIGALMLTGCCCHDGSDDNDPVPVDPYNGHEYVDLGLPSGLKWATCNVGASKPEEYGDYFAWGETVPYYEPGYAQENPQTHWKDDNKKTYGYNWKSYKWLNDSGKALTKYCNNSYYGEDGFTDSKTTLDPEDDAASYNWGGSWRMPTKGDFDELLATKTKTDDYTWTWCDGSTTKYAGTDIIGLQIVRNSTGATLFLPAAWFRGGTDLIVNVNQGNYWSSSLYTGNPSGAYDFNILSNIPAWGTNNRYFGYSVRPVAN